MKNAIDLYSGIGGWTLGMKLSGVNNVASFEWWHEANQTHNINFGTQHQEFNIRELDVKKNLKFKQRIDFVVGSPPCTQFSFANRGGNGDIQDGLVDIYKFLEVVEYLKPKYWAMENVPRVAKILEHELEKGSLKRFKKLVKVIEVVDAADYGVPQNRKRMLAGDFPVHLFHAYKSQIKQVTLGEVIKSLSQEKVVDPLYGYESDKRQVTEMENEVDLTPEEERINRDSKTYHPVYNKMSFPDRLNRPGRTVTATCTRVSRESIIVKSKTGFRRLNVRERGVLQGFPITYQFYGRTLSSKFKMIGNAVPPVLTHYVFQAMLERSPEEVTRPADSAYKHEQPAFKAFKSNLGLPKRKYPENRRFQFSIPHLRYGSGVRFELSNIETRSEEVRWSFKFYYGNSKSIKSLPLNSATVETLKDVIDKKTQQLLLKHLAELGRSYKSYSPHNLQRIWTSADDGIEVFQFLDKVGNYIGDVLERETNNGYSDEVLEALVKERNKKLLENKNSILLGCYFLSELNSKLFPK